MLSFWWGVRFLYEGLLYERPELGLSEGSRGGSLQCGYQCGYTVDTQFPKSVLTVSLSPCSGDIRLRSTPDRFVFLSTTLIPVLAGETTRAYRLY